MTKHAILDRDDARAARLAARNGEHARHTAGLGRGLLQANVVILPEAHALDFMRYCQRNPKPCPLIGVSDTGNPFMHTLGADLDIRTDVPAYNIYRDGILTGSSEQIADLWRDDFVAFAIGCSFTFEHALADVGLSLYHVKHDRTVPMFRTNVPTIAAGPFRGPLVVSMRAIPAERVGEVTEICARFPLAHGAPVHSGDPAAIGITDLDQPDWGDASPVPEGYVPVFWACGVTPQSALAQARLPLCITHKPGHMLITDVSDDAEVPVLDRND